MLRQAVQRLVPVKSAVVSQVQRNVGLSAVAAQKANLDPIQQLFVDKIREYRSRSTGGKLVDATPDVQASLTEQLSNLERTFGAKGLDFTQFPVLNFAEPALVWTGLSEEQRQKIQENAAQEKAKQAKKSEEEQAEEEEDYF